MHAADDTLIFSATDLSNFLACSQLTLLDRAAALGGPKPRKFDDPGAEVLRRRGKEHERAYLERLEAGGCSVVRIEGPARRTKALATPEARGPPASATGAREADAARNSLEQAAELDHARTPHDRWRTLAARTLDAMRTGADVIYQGCLFDGTWLGRPDFLRRVEEPSDLGSWSYEVVDAKLAREAKGGALLQLCVYADLLEGLQGRPPERVHLALGGPEPRTESLRLADYAAYYRSVKARFEETIAGHATADKAIAEADGGGHPPNPDADRRSEPPGDPVPQATTNLPFAPDPVPHCEICAWRTRCDGERRETDHLALVADITRRQRRALSERGITTARELSELPTPVDPPLEGVSRVSVERIREQARIQVEGRETGEPRYELFTPPVEGEGLASLPEPSPGDLFFDIEGDPYALGDGIEYLFGFVDAAGEYTGLWALDRRGEKAAFEAFIDLVTARLEEHPDLHVYHYHHYERTHLQGLMGRYGTREEELDRMLRGGVFVDLHRVVRQSLRASVESYSIKKLEPFYGFERDVELRRANRALANFEAWLELGGDRDKHPELLQEIEGYNRDDCRSTLCLRDWLEARREELGREVATPIPRPVPESPEPSEAVAEASERTAALADVLTRDVPLEPKERTPDQHARWLLAQLLGYYRREDKSTWWEYYRCLELSEEERIEDRAALGGLAYEGVVDEVKRSLVHRYRFPPQDHGIRVGRDVRDPATEGSPGTVVEIDDHRGTIELKRGKRSPKPHPQALIPCDIVGNPEQRESLIRLAEQTIEHGLADDHPNRAAVDLLLRHPPRVGQGPGEALRREGEETLEAARRLAGALDRSVLPLQGPPGSGKTYTGARMNLRLLEAGKRVGVTATSHKVIGNLLDEVCKAAREGGIEIRGIQKADEEQRCKSEGEIEATDDNAAVHSALAEGEVRLAGGTAWLWSREEMAGSVDVLFVDEAGQLSLANALAVSQAAGSLVLLGDPRQLEQPQQGVHPPGADVSALDHLLGDQATVPADRGLFLDRTWRLHPAICAFTSEVFYRGRLESQEDLERQVVRGPEPLNGSGLRLVSVQHEGNRSEAPEEVAEVARLVTSALGSNATWIDEEGEEHTLTTADILVVAPYNAQVSALLAELPDGSRVGTVDKFQGQEAAIVVYSMTTSSAEEAPRGMDFLYSPNRLNVATSRARCLTVLVASPAVFAPECRTPKQMKLANAFCRYREIPRRVNR